MRVFRGILRAFFVALALAALAAGLLVATGPGQQFLASQASRLISTPERTVTLTGLSGLATGATRLERIAIADSQGRVAVLSDVSIDWSPRALLARTIQIEHLAIAHSDIVRAPLAREGSTAANESLPDWALRIDHFDLAEIALGQTLVQQEIRLAAQGALTLDRTPAIARLTLEARRIDTVPGSLSADIAFVPDQSQLDLDIDLNEPSAGTLARLLDVPGLPAISAKLKGGGTFDDWKTDLAIAFDGRETVTGNARIVATTDGHRLTAALAGTPGPLLPHLITPLVAGNVDVALDVTRQADGSLTITTADLASATTRLSARGTVDLAARSIDLTGRFNFGDAQSEIQFTLPDGSVGQLGAATLNARATGALGNADVALDGTLASANIQNYLARNLNVALESRSADLEQMALPFSVQLSADTFQTPIADANPVLKGPIVVSANGVWRDGTAIIEQGTIKTAALNTALNGTVRSASQSLDLNVDGTLAATANEQAQSAFGAGDIAFKAKLARDDAGRISVNALNAASAALTLSGNVALGASDIDASLQASIGDLSAFRPELSGGITATLSAKGERDAPAVALKAKGEKIALAGKALSDLSLDFDGVMSPAAPRGDLNLTATLDGKALNASGHVTSSNGTISIDAIRMQVDTAAITGAISRTQDNQPAGRLTIEVPDLAVLGPLLLRDDLAGSLNGTVDLLPDGDGPAARIALTSPQVSFSDARLEQTVIDAIISSPAGGLSVDGSARIANLKSGTADIRNIALTASNNGAATAFDITASLDGAPLAAKGTMTSADGAIQLALSDAHATLQGIAARLAGPASLAIVDSTAQIEQARLDIGGGTVSISGTAGNALDLDIKLKSFPAQTVDRFAKQGLGGTISGTLAVSGTPAAPQIAYDVAWVNATATPLSTASLPALSVTANGQYVSDTVRLNAAISGSGINANVNGSVQLGDSPGGNLAIKGTLPFEAAAPALARAGLRLNGIANLDVNMSGPLSAPQFAGVISTKGATFIDTGSAVVINNISGSARLAGKSLTIETITGTLGSSGKLTVSGSIGTDPNSGFPADLVVAMRDGRYADGTLVVATFGADLTLKGPLAQTPVLGGTVNIERADISLPEKLPGSISPLGIDHVNAPADVRRQNAQLEDITGSTASGGGLALDLTVNAPRRVFVRGRGLDAELGGSLRLNGTTANTQATGGFRLIRGRLDILTKRLTISRGIISFSGSLDPVVDFSATSSSGSVTATILVTGPASNPRISFSSSPALPDDEVLAQLLFNKSLTTLSPAQIVQLASALSALTGVGGSAGILDRLRQTLGVDNLDITTDESGQNAAVGVGRYINDRTYVGVKQGTTSDSTSVTTNIDLTDTLKAKGEVSGKGETKAGLFFEKEY